MIDAAASLAHRTMLMVLYSTGMRSAELLQLQVPDIDSRRMLIHIQQGKGGRDRYVPLSSVLLATLRMYYLWMQPKTWMFQGPSRAGGPTSLAPARIRRGAMSCPLGRSRSSRELRGSCRQQC